MNNPAEAEERRLLSKIKNIDEYARGHEDDIYRGVWMRSQPEEEMRRRYEGRMGDMRDDFYDWKEAHAGKGESAVIDGLTNILKNMKAQGGGRKIKKLKRKASKRKASKRRASKRKASKRKGHKKGKTMKNRKH